MAETHPDAPELPDPPVRGLEDIWPLQANLNSRAGIPTERIGLKVRAAERKGGFDEHPALRVEVGRALKMYIDALAAECHELQDTLAWKHWYREAREGRQYELQDLQNARVEVADMLFFWVSLAQVLGLTPDDVYRLYEKKLGINHRRQDEDRSQAEHAEFEDENRQVT